ncbi:DUF2855 family protein [Aestuariirhabdus sp. Z084]|uniref:DUF2855 family protein n=1 Tax=Aestuariirhabdus haliotis TaxID=2918751 RepID=UPI00201B35D9|nr:DUF2855 family protein [Aestuariirhabdus haliotis]MCL6416604.1 DUF2855 family protein [Aestuariirhabdus haliotis]MCL6420639.1 DUF2855 family protein [Aestuariirhabdus haliotis]
MSPSNTPINVTCTVDKTDFADLQVLEQALQKTDSLAEGQVLFQVDRFSFTANNITYAAMGNMLRYWEFFPQASGRGVIPVWGFADVIGSNCDAVSVGERVYGYFPMASHVVMQPAKINDSSFVDGTEHRRSLPVIYNQYIRVAADPIYSADTEALQMLLRPLFTTSFLLDDFFADSDFFGARSLVLTSASSKTALGMAFLLQQHRDAREQQYEIVGLTSQKNLDFVQGLGCYDRVLTYDRVSELDAGVPTALVDFAGMADLIGELHEHFQDQLQYSCRVGASHWDATANASGKLPGPTPQMFFAPTQAQKRLQEWGGVEFQTRVATAWFRFIKFVDQWMEVDESLGVAATEQVYQQTLKGQVNPCTGNILSLLDR